MSKLITIYTTEGCGPCKIIKTRLKAAESSGRTDGWNIEIVDITGDPQIARERGIRAVPTTIITDDAGVLHTLVGAPMDYLDQLEKYV